MHKFNSIAQPEFIATQAVARNLCLLVVLLIAQTVLAAESSKQHVLEAPPTYTLKFPLGLDARQAVMPKNNPLSLQKIKLGKRLFFDKRLSVNNTLACASCHQPQFAFADDQAVSPGALSAKGERNTPTIINRVFSSRQFYDGKAASLEAQVQHSLISPTEMANADVGSLVAKLSEIKEYQDEFQQVFFANISLLNISRAIASFERTLLSGNSRFDRFILGETHAITAAEKRGFNIFQGKGNCIYCHGGHNFSNEQFHNTGVGMDSVNPDIGLMKISNDEKDKGRFKTPTLRSLIQTAPYMHDGSLKTIEEVIKFYSDGGIPNINKDSRIGEINLSVEQQADLSAFLRSLSVEIVLESS